MATDSSTQHRRLTLSEIAREAGVSKSLASLALRGDKGVKRETRQRILAVAERLGYQPNGLALSLAHDGPRIIGALVTDLTNPFNVEVVDGIESAAEHHGCSVMIANGRRDRKWMATQLEAFLSLGVDGIVVISTWVHPEVLSAVAKRTPVVVVGSSATKHPGVDSVQSDDFHGAGQTVEHLVAMGHETIAFVTESNRASSTNRYSGYLHAMQRLYRENSTISSSIDALEENRGLLGELVRARSVTAMIAANDMTAVRLLDLAEESGIAVPRDLSIAGYDNTLFARAFRPRLTSIDQPRHAMGTQAVDMILEKLAGREIDRHEVLRPKLITRESTSTPPPVSRAARYA
jgi:DNA-binding LacI/PurR family transcriptional regulator